MREFHGAPPAALSVSHRLRGDARHLGFRLMAEELCFTQDPISHRIAGVEAFLGAALVKFRARMREEAMLGEPEPERRRA